MAAMTDPNEDPHLKDYIAYIRMQEDLERQFPNQWVVIYDAELIGHYDSFDSARAEAAKQGLSLANCMIQRLNANPPIILSYRE